MTGDVMVVLHLIDGGLSFDTGPRPITWNDVVQAYTLDGTIGSIPVDGSWKLATGGETNTGTFSYTMNAALGGATGTNLMLANVQPTNAGNYTVVVTNNFGALTSQVAVLTVVSAQPATLRVPQDYATIKAAVAAANNGDTVLVSPGTYNEINIQITKNLTVTSLTGATNTIIDNQHNGRGFIVTGATLTNVNIIGFTIQNAQIPYYQDGGAIQVVSGKCKISRCIIQGTSGAGDYGSSPIANIPGWSSTNAVDNVVVEDSIVHNNFAANGAGIGFAVVIRCTIYGNTGGNNCMALVGCNATNCTVYGNSGGYDGGGYGGNWNSCIIWNNSPIQLKAPISVNYCIVQGGFTGTGNLSSDPLFVNAGSGDFHLQANSPAIDAGNPAPAFNDPDGSRADIGAYPRSHHGYGPQLN